MFPEGMFVDSRKTSSDSVYLLLWEQGTEATNTGTSADLKFDSTEGTDLLAILNPEYPEANLTVDKGFKEKETSHRNWKCVVSSSDLTPMSSEDISSEFWKIFSDKQDYLFDQGYNTSISSQSLAHQHIGKHFEYKISPMQTSSNEQAPIGANNNLLRQHLYRQLLELESNEAANYSSTSLEAVRPTSHSGFAATTGVSDILCEDTTYYDMEYPIGSVLLYQGFTLEIKKVNQIIFENKHYSRAKHIHELIKQTVFDEWNEVNPFPQDDVVQEQLSKNHLLLWKPLSIYSAFTADKFKTIDNNVPSTSCFGKINMRNKRAWSRSPNRAKKMRL